jgi:hypothetical protein
MRILSYDLLLSTIAVAPIVIVGRQDVWELAVCHDPVPSLGQIRRTRLEEDHRTATARFRPDAKPSSVLRGFC